MATPSQQAAFLAGAATDAHHYLGAHPQGKGFSFTVYAPNAKSVRLVGDFNGWNINVDFMKAIGNGFWQIRNGYAQDGQAYKYVIEAHDGYLHWKADPYAAFAELPPKTASVLHNPSYRWTDKAWRGELRERQAYNKPLSIYELHLGSWRRSNGRMPTYRSIAKPLIAHVKACGFTHVEFLPLTHHPFYGSWGYQCTGYFAPSPLYGNPKDLKALINALHRAEIGVIMDWAPAHFPMDDHGLYRFDGSPLFADPDPRRGHHPDWGTAIFNYATPSVRSFLLSSAAKWIEEFHIDGLRVDAVASMLYLNYSRQDGEWIPNEYGGPENNAAVYFLKLFNDSLHARFPGVLTIAEESTAWPGVTAPTEHGGLGFDYKWDMGWMNDTLEYFKHDPIYRKHKHQKLTFRGLYVHSERYLLPLSHDEVVHLKGSLPEKMPGDDWQKLASVRCLLAWQAAQPGKTLLFMGMEFGQRNEWNHDVQLDWDSLDNVANQGLMAFISDLNRLITQEPSLHAVDFDHSGVSWTQMDDEDNSVIVFIRHSPNGRSLIVAFNFTPVVRYNYAVGASGSGKWIEILNSDSLQYGGSGVISSAEAIAQAVPSHGQSHSLLIGLPPLGVSIWAMEEK